MESTKFWASGTWAVVDSLCDHVDPCKVIIAPKCAMATLEEGKDYAGQTLQWDPVWKGMMTVQLTPVALSEMWFNVLIICDTDLGLGWDASLRENNTSRHASSHTKQMHWFLWRVNTSLSEWTHSLYRYLWDLKPSTHNMWYRDHGHRGTHGIWEGHQLHINDVLYFQYI